jgi:hypothetical protein
MSKHVAVQCLYARSLDLRSTPTRKSRRAVTNPRISDLTRADKTRSTPPGTHPVNEAAATTTVTAAASPCSLDKMPPISDVPGS